MPKKLYVGNLSYDVDEETLKSWFASYGTVQSVNLVMDRETGRSKGYGFVEMSSDDEAQEAIDALNESEQGGRTIKVAEANPPKPRPQRGGGGGGYGRGGRGGGGGGGYGRGGRGGGGGGGGGYRGERGGGGGGGRFGEDRGPRRF